MKDKVVIEPGIEKYDVVAKGILFDTHFTAVHNSVKWNVGIYSSNNKEMLQQIENYLEEHYPQSRVREFVHPVTMTGIPIKEEAMSMAKAKLVEKKAKKGLSSNREDNAKKLIAFLTEAGIDDAEKRKVMSRAYGIVSKLLKSKPKTSTANTTKTK